MSPRSLWAVALALLVAPAVHAQGTEKYLPSKSQIFAQVDPKVVQALGSAALNPSRLGDPGEFASLVVHIIENRYLNATTLSIDAGARLPNV